MGQSGLALTSRHWTLPRLCLGLGKSGEGQVAIPPGVGFDDNLPFSNRLPPAQNDPAGVEPCISGF